MSKTLKETISQVIPDNQLELESATAFAPSNIALVKYWGKRDTTFNLPVTSSLSISLADKGCHTKVSLIEGRCDKIILNNKPAALTSSFSQRIIQFLDLVRFQNQHFQVETESTVPIASGLASSACGFAALTRCLNKLYNWQVSEDVLSMLARVGSGSACRSLWHGFVHWQKGHMADGSDSFARPLPNVWPSLRLGILLNDSAAKKVSSTIGMLNTQKTSPFYDSWPHVVEQDMTAIKTALDEQNFELLGKTAEANATAMHALMLSARPSIIYSNSNTIDCMSRVWQARNDGIPVYFTQDAGPHIKLLFEAENLDGLRILFPQMDVVQPFSALDQ